MKKVAFLDRDGTLIVEPADFQIDSLEKLELLPHVISALLEIKKRGYELIMISNQDYLGSIQYPLESFDKVQKKLISLFSSQGIEFDEIFICPHGPQEGCSCRKPKLGMLPDELIKHLDRNTSFVIGDRNSDLEMARNLGVRGYLLDKNTSWNQIIDELFYRPYEVTAERKTLETFVSIKLSEKNQPNDISTGLGFFDHMLDSLIKFSAMSAQIKAQGDIHIDVHHLIEDVAIVLGGLFRQLTEVNPARERFHGAIAMDESSCQCLLDIGGRFHFVYQDQFTNSMIGKMPAEMIKHFFYSLAENAKWTLHLDIKGENNHHMAEAAFKIVGQAIGRSYHKKGQILSTKGSL